MAVKTERYIYRERERGEERRGRGRGRGRGRVWLVLAFISCVGVVYSK